MQRNEWEWSDFETRMASPHASSFLCLPFSDYQNVSAAYKVYYYVCLGSGLLGAPGAVLFLTQVTCGEASKMITRSQRNILVNLALADLFADLGVIVRSLFYLLYWEKDTLYRQSNFSSNLDAAGGGTAVETWLFFWYLSSYFWTFFFAVDIFNSKFGGCWSLWMSHLVTWLYCFILVVSSIAALWACPPYLECTEDKYCIVGHFLCTFGPIIIFMVALPIFYLSILRKMEKTFREGPIIEVKKLEKEKARRKTFMFILVFYICWLVNVLDGIVLIVAHMISRGPSDPDHGLYRFLYQPIYIYTVWTLEAFLNPLQGLLNAIAYGNLGSSILRLFRSLKRKTELTIHTSWSAEYIDVDFRHGTGRIRHTTQRKQ